MNVKNFLFNKIPGLVEAFPQARFRYGYDVFGDSHIVEINPDCLLDGDLGQAAWNLRVEAARLFPYELVTFVSETSCTALEEVEHEWIGKDYKPVLHTPTMADADFLETGTFSDFIQPLLGGYSADWDVPNSSATAISGVSVPFSRMEYSGNITISQAETSGAACFGNTRYAIAA